MRRSLLGASHDSSTWAMVPLEYSRSMKATSGIDGMMQPRRERAYPGGCLVQPVAQNREIVGREVPGDADVLLVETEVDPARRDEVEIAQVSRFDEVAHGDDRGAVEEGVSRHQHQPATLGELDELEALARGRGERLLDEDVLSRLERRASKREVRRHRRRERQGVDRFVGEDVVDARVGLHGRVPTLDQLEAVGIAVANRDDLGAVELVEVADEVRAPVAEADNCDADTIHLVEFL